MKALNVFFGALVVAASLVASPAVLGSLLATVAGLLLMASPALPGIAQAMPAQALRLSSKSSALLQIRCASSRWTMGPAWSCFALWTASWLAVCIALKPEGGHHEQNGFPLHAGWPGLAVAWA
jgi:hypothetical protein